MLQAFNDYVVQVFQASKVHYGLLTIAVMAVMGTAIATLTEMVLRALGFKGEILKH